MSTAKKNILSRQLIKKDINSIRLRYSLPIVLISVLLSTSLMFYNLSYYQPQFSVFIHSWFNSNGSSYSTSTHYLNAKNAFEKKEYPLAVDELTLELGSNPNNAEAYFLLGRVYELYELEDGKKYYAKMATSYEKFIELKKKGKEVEYAKLKLSQYYIRDGLRQDNVDLLNKAEKYLLTLDQSDASVTMALGAIYLDKKNYDEAIALFESSANLPPNELKLKYNSLGLAYIKKGLFSKAQTVLEIAVEIEPDNKYAHNNLGFAYSKQGKYQEAKDEFEKALRLDPTYENAKKNLIFIEREISKK